jgi:hypothetical protein
MTDQHTPGPWRWVPQPNFSWQYQDLMSASGEVVLSGEEAPDPSGIEISHADARLIEAAPEMWDLIVVGVFLAFTTGDEELTAEEVEWREKAVALIAKVRGTQ